MNRRSHRAKQADRFPIDSVSAVKEFLRHRPGCIKRLRADISLKQAIQTEFADVLAEHQIKLENSMEHRILAEVEIETRDAEELIGDTSDDPLWIACDHITDPRNFGAILRTAAFFGVRRCLIPRDRQVGLSPATVATSMGALSLLDIFETNSLSRIMDQMRSEGRKTVGADMTGSEGLTGSLALDNHLLLVVGSEERGLSAAVRERCDALVRIAGAHPGLESLNVSVAAGILIRDLLIAKKTLI